MKGTVKFFNLQKRYGYITNEEGDDVFVHVSNIEKGRTYTGYNKGDEVEFNIEVGEKGPQAIDVKFANRKPVNKN